jgi:hypothetical protein
MFIPDPGTPIMTFLHPGSWISDFLPKNCKQAFRNMGLEPGIRTKFSPDPRSGDQKSTGSQIWIRNTAYHAQYELITNITLGYYY